MEIYDVLIAFGAECSQVCKPMSLQLLFKNHELFNHNGEWRQYESFSNNTYMFRRDNAQGYFNKGIVLSGDTRMTEEVKDKVIDIIYACYDKADLNLMAWM